MYCHRYGIDVLTVLVKAHAQRCHKNQNKNRQDDQHDFFKMMMAFGVGIFYIGSFCHINKI